MRRDRAGQVSYGAAPVERAVVPRAWQQEQLRMESNQRLDRLGRDGESDPSTEPTQVCSHACLDAVASFAKKKAPST